MNLVDLNLLQEVARLGSFASVARIRGVDPSSIGRLIAGIEAELGLRLFARTTRRMELTEAGEIYLARIAPLSEELDRAAEEARAHQAEPRGSLRLSASVTFGQHVIIPRLAAFRQAYPAIRVEGIFSDANIDLVGDRIDLAIRLAPAIEGDYFVSKLMDTHYRVVASPKYLATAPVLNTPDDLQHHRVILFPFQSYRSRWIFKNLAGQVQEQNVDGDLVLSPAGALLDAAVAGHGPALLPTWLIDKYLTTGALQTCLDNWSVTATTFDTAAWMIYPSRSYLPAKVRAMIDFLRASF